MRVALVVPGGVDRSGEYRVIPCLLWLLERISREHDVHVFATRGAAAQDRYRLRGATIHAMGGPGRRAVPTLRALLREHRRGPFAVVHGFWAGGPGVITAVAGRLLRRPVLLHIPGGDLVALPDIGYGGRRTLTGRIRVKIALAAANHRTAPSEVICNQAAALGYPAERLPLGVSREEWVPRAPAPRDPTAPVRLVHVASLNRVKDQGTLLRAARRLADRGLDYTLDLVGVDTLGGEIQRLASELGIDDRIRFHGFLPQDRLRPMVSAADLLVLSSRHEAGPVVAAEAAVVGVPTVGTAVGMLREWAPEAAAVVPTGDADALADTVAALSRDDTTRLRIAAAAQARALAEDADWSAQRILDLYQEIEC